MRYTFLAFLNFLKSVSQFDLYPLTGNNNQLSGICLTIEHGLSKYMQLLQAKWNANVGKAFERGSEFGKIFCVPFGAGHRANIDEYVGWRIVQPSFGLQTGFFGRREYNQLYGFQ